MKILTPFLNGPHLRSVLFVFSFTCFLGVASAQEWPSEPKTVKGEETVGTYAMGLNLAREDPSVDLSDYPETQVYGAYVGGDVGIWISNVQRPSDLEGFADVLRMDVDFKIGPGACWGIASQNWICH